MVNTVDTSNSVTRIPGARASAPQGGTNTNETSETTAVRQTLSAGGSEQPASAVQAAPESEQVSSRDLATATGEVTNFIQTVSRSLQISVDEDLGETVIRVLDRDTDELVRQIPAEEFLEIARYLRDRADAAPDPQELRGVLLDSER